MRTAKYTINGGSIEVSMEGSPEVSYGKNEFLSNKEQDITYGLDWYEQGYRTFNFLTKNEFEHLKSGLHACISNLASDEGLDLSGTALENYHTVVNSSELHSKIVTKTRDLFANDFNFPIEELIPKFEKLVGFGLSDIDPYTKKKMHIIVRINRPNSNDFNPPHKDIYFVWDKEGRIPQFVNLWVPIAGVSSKSSLPMAAGTHRLPEDKVLRTFGGGAVVEGNTYRVNAVLEWDGSSELTRADVGYGDVLLFSNHLIHGLAKNEQADQTRIALEFRLFKKDLS